MVCLARGALLQAARLVALDALCHRLEHSLVLRPVLLLALFRAVGDLWAALDIDGLAEGSAVGAAHVLQVLGHRWVCGDGIGDACVGIDEELDDAEMAFRGCHEARHVSQPSVV